MIYVLHILIQNMKKECFSWDVQEKLQKKIINTVCKIEEIEAVKDLIENKVRHTVPIIERKNVKDYFKASNKFDMFWFKKILDDMIEGTPITTLTDWEVGTLEVSEEAIQILKKVKKHCEAIV